MFPLKQNEHRGYNQQYEVKVSETALGEFRASLSGACPTTWGRVAVCFCFLSSPVGCRVALGSFLRFAITGR